MKCKRNSLASTLGVLFCAGALALASGCIRRSEYDALKADMDALRVDLTDQIGARDGELKLRKGELDDLNSTLRAEEAKADALDTRKSELEVELQSARTRADARSAELAQVIKDRSRLEGSIEELTKGKDALDALRRNYEERARQFVSLKTLLRSLSDAGKVRVKAEGGRLVVQLPSDVLFDSGSPDLSEEGTTSIGEVGAVLAKLRGRKFQVEGHTDDRPIQTRRFPNNWSLASARAISVVGVLIENGVSPEQINASSFGEFRPVSSNGDDQGRTLNRRIEIVLVPDLSRLPGFGADKL